MEAPEPTPASETIGRQVLTSLLGIPLTLLGGVSTILGGFLLCFYVAGRVSGIRPWPDLFELLWLWLFFGACPLLIRIFALRVSPGARRFCVRMLICVLSLWIVAAIDGIAGPTNWYSILRRERLPGNDAALMERTVVSPHLDAAVTPGTNVLYCGTFQLAWDEVCRLTGGDLRFDVSSPVVDSLNKHVFTKQSLDEPSYVAVAGFVRDNVHEQLRAAVKEKFRGRFEPRLLPEGSRMWRSQDIVAYSCLYKQLSFSTPFECLDETFSFGGTPVSAFGIGPYRPSVLAMYPQVMVLDYRDQNDFVIELKSNSDGDRLILAKVRPNPTLGATVLAVSERMAAGQPIAAGTNDLLTVPRIKLDVLRSFSEILGLALVPQNTNVARDLRILTAAQHVVFDLSEKGAELRSEAHLGMGCSAPQEPVRAHKMIFDKPFLVLMQRRDAKVPFFALWVDNPEVMVSWK